MEDGESRSSIFDLQSSRLTQSFTFASTPTASRSIFALLPDALRIWGRHPGSRTRHRERGAAPAPPRQAGCHCATMIDRCLESSYASTSDPPLIETSLQTALSHWDGEHWQTLRCSSRSRPPGSMRPVWEEISA